MSGERKVVSERVAKAETELKRSVEELKRRADDAAIALLKGMDPPDDDTAVRNMREILSDEQRAELSQKFEQFLTKPLVTKPSPEMLAQSRHESTPLPAPANAGVEPVSGTRILVVDAEGSTRAALADILRTEGFRVWEASDGWQAATAIMEMGRVDLVLLDWELPRVTGAEFLQWLNRSQWALVPLLIISNSAGPFGELDDRYVFVRPIHMPRLLQTIRVRIRERSP